MSLRLSATLVRYRGAALAALACLLTYAFSGLYPLAYDFSFTSLFIGKGEAYDDLRDYLSRFGADVNVFVVAVESDGLYSDAVARELSALVEELERLEGVAEVIAPTNVSALEGEEGVLRTVPLYPGVDDDLDWADVRRRAIAHPIYGGAIFGRDGRHAALVIRYGLEAFALACDDGVDNDGDGLVDCHESGCAERAAFCAPRQREDSGAACTNGVDDDGDGLVDCDDADCLASPACSWRQSEERGRSACGDGVDNDGDGRVDCLDADCLRHPDVPACSLTVGLLELLERADAENDDWKLSFGGVPYVSDAYTRVIQHDLVTFVPLTGAIVALLLAFLFRNGRGVAVPTLVVALSITGAVGLMMQLGGSLNIINSSLPTLLLVIAVADTVHIVARYFEESATASSPREAIERTFAAMLGACALTSLTSAVGFASLLSAHLPIIRNFGLQAALGILFAYIVAMLLIPALLMRLPLPDPAMQERAARSTDASRLVTGFFVHLVTARRGVALAITAGIVAFSAVGIALVEADSHLMEELTDAHPASVANRTIEAHLDGVLSGAIVVYGEPGDMARPEVLRALDELGAFAEGWRDEEGGALVARAFSLADVVKEAHAAYRSDQRARVIPESRAAVVSLLDQVPVDTRAAVVSADYAVAHLTLRMVDGGARAWASLRGELEQRIEAELKPLGSFKVVITGSSTLGQDAMAFITRDLLSSLLIATLIIVLVMTTLNEPSGFRSASMRCSSSPRSDAHARAPPSTIRSVRCATA